MSADTLLQVQLRNTATVMTSSPFDLLLMKTDPLGNLEWQRAFGYPGDDAALSVIKTNDGGFAMVGFTNSLSESYDILLVKTDQMGLIPEFPSFLIIPLFMITTLPAAIVYRIKHSM